MDSDYPQDEELPQFYLACKKDDLEEIKVYLQRGFPINGHIDSRFGDEFCGYTPLHFAVSNASIATITYLLEQGADITAKSADCRTPVHQAYYGFRSEDLVPMLFEHSNTLKTYANAVDKTGLTHFHILCALNLTPIVERFIKQGANVDCSVSLLAEENCGFTPLHFAVQRGHAAIVKLLFENNVNPNVKCGRGLTPLHLALKLSDLSIVRLLLKFDVEANIKDSRGSTALHIAVEQKTEIDVVKSLINKGASIHAPNFEKQTPLDLAVKSKWYEVVDVMLTESNVEDEKSGSSFNDLFRVSDFQDPCNEGNLKAIKVFVKHGFSVNSRVSSSVKDEFRGYTPLHFAVMNKHLHVIKYLLSEGASIHEPNDDDETPLQLAVKSKMHLVADAMVSMSSSEKPDVNFSTLSDQLDFFEACHKDDVDAIKAFVIKNEFLVNSHSDSSFGEEFHSFTPLHFAVRNKSIEAVNCLLANGADITEKNDQGQTPIHQAYYASSDDLIRLMFENSKVNTYIDAADGNGVTHFSICCALKIPVLEEFVLSGADVDSSVTCPDHTDFGLTPLHVAVKKGYVSTVRLLLECGADHGLTYRGSTPLHLAIERADVSSIRLLLDYGADFKAKDSLGRTALHRAFLTCSFRHPKIIELFSSRIPQHLIDETVGEVFLKNKTLIPFPSQPTDK